MTRRNRSGESGQPCLNPLTEKKNGDALPLTRTLNGMLEIQPMNHLIKIKGNPRWVKIILKYNQCTLSKALDKSTFKIIPLLFLMWSECKTSCAVLIAS